MPFLIRNGVQIRITNYEIRIQLHNYSSFSLSESPRGASGCINSRSALIETNLAADKTLFSTCTSIVGFKPCIDVLSDASIFTCSGLKLPRRSVHIKPHTEKRRSTSVEDAGVGSTRLAIRHKMGKDKGISVQNSNGVALQLKQIGRAHV